MDHCAEDCLTERGRGDQHTEDQNEQHGEYLIAPAPCLRTPTRPQNDDDGQQDRNVDGDYHQTS
jgi:hypothetical protein